MAVVSSKAFSENPLHYLELSRTEDVEVKRGKEIFLITPKTKKHQNPIDPEDPYWDDPKNIEDYERILKDIDEGKMKVFTLTPEIEKEWFGDL